MRDARFFTAAILTCMLTTTTAFALTMTFGPSQIAESGEGCVMGYTSDHSIIAYFRGDTALLNDRLASLAEKAQNKGTITVVMHAGATDVENAEEKPHTGFHGNEHPAFNRVPFDWSVRETCPFERVGAGTCKGPERHVTIEIWIADRISLDELLIPENFVVKSGGEIERFVKRHSSDQ